MRKAMTMTIAGALMLALTAGVAFAASVLWDKNCRRWARMAYLGSSGDIGCRVGVAGACSLVGKWCVGTAA
jgi:hypothetical protein